MPLTQERIDRGIDDLLAQVVATDGAEAELAAALAEFRAAGGPGVSNQALAGRRAVEWFLLERHNASLQGVPLELAMHGGFGLEEDLPDEEVLESLVSSFCGVFEVSDVRPGEGVWVRDLLAFGEHPLAEPEGSHALARGDVLVGRMFPIGGGLHRISHAAGVFREPGLITALAADLDRAREDRRGVIRLSQAELESMFWQRSDSGESEEQIVARARDVLTKAGLDPADVALVLRQLADTKFNERPVVLGGEDTIGNILDTLAFETEIDLDLARRALFEAWPILARPTAVPTGENPSAAVDVHDAVASFERGRAEGRDLEELFDELERHLQLEDEGEDEADEPAPDFPGVVGAMVEEFLWETERESGPDVAHARRCLTRLSAFGAPIGVFEEMGARDLLSFTSVWLPEWGELSGADEARAVLAALRAFCEWAEERHEVPLQSAYESDVIALENSLPRVAEANQKRVRVDDVTLGDVYVVETAAEGRARVRDAGGGEHSLAVDPELAVHLRPGDHVRAATRGGERLAVYCVYPPECAALQSMG